MSETPAKQPPELMSPFEHQRGTAFECLIQEPPCHQLPTICFGQRQFVLPYLKEIALHLDSLGLCQIATVTGSYFFSSPILLNPLHKPLHMLVGYVCACAHTCRLMTPNRGSSQRKKPLHFRPLPMRRNSKNRPVLTSTI